MPQPEEPAMWTRGPEGELELDLEPVWGFDLLEPDEFDRRIEAVEWGGE